MEINLEGKRAAPSVSAREVVLPPIAIATDGGSNQLGCDWLHP